MLGKGSGMLETQRLWLSSNFVRKTISLKFCCMRTCPAITRTRNYLKCLFTINFLQVKISASTRGVFQCQPTALLRA